ncbi:MAG: Fosmidomycin resistance protein [Bryobacteraceae bacterium]|nr:Fosmidomycin resistance protein [Bryobacteraceae bacterium]
MPPGKYNESLSANPRTIPVSTPPAAARSSARSPLSTLAFYSAGHFAVDLYSSALGVFQPLLASQVGINLTQAGVLGGVMVFAGSVMQPVYGILSDRFHSRLFSVLAPAIAGLFISALGLAPSYSLLLLLVFLGASAVASFHPQASVRAAAEVSGSRGKAMAFFISAGSLGFAIGPTYFSVMLERFGLSQSYWAAIPGVLVTLALLFAIPETHVPAHQRQRIDWGPLRAVWRPLFLLYMLVFLRSVVQISFTQFLPLYLSKERGFTFQSASLALTLYSTMGAIGGLTGGHLADRFGGRNVILYSMAGSVPFLLLFFEASGGLALAGLAFAGLILLSTNPVNIVMAQELAPGQSGTVSALMMGFAWGMAGIIFIPLAGLFADHYSLHQVLRSFVLFPALGFLLAFRLPKAAQ